ncbi:MAG: hypothetical protein GX301_02500 [Gracilibacteraceae bacterium]|nr:hypothetical protein [Gracilibacteraceae bacterium]
MANIEKRHIIDSNKLSGEQYFTSILQEAYSHGLLCDSEIESIQLQCIHFLAYKCERYNGGESSSIRVEAAESIMKSNLYTIGLYLKSLPDVDFAVSELKKSSASEMYQKGRKLINVRLRSAKHIYNLVQKNKLATPNYSYNSTINEGIKSFFKAYNPDYEAHEIPASIDYQLCNPVIDLAGIEFIQKYLENLFYENAFCRNFDESDIHHLLYGYDKEYKELLVNIFELVLTAALGCSLSNRSVVKLGITAEDIKYIHYELSEYNDHLLALKIRETAGKVLEELNIENLPLGRYIEKSLPKITTNILHAVRTNTLDKTFVSKAIPDLKPGIRFVSGAKMHDENYRKLIDELLVCRHSSDKLALIKEKVKSFEDLEDLLFDAMLNEEEITSVFSILGDVEIAALVRRHPFKSDIQAVDLSEAEMALRQYLKNYIDRLPKGKQKEIFEKADSLIVE